jgi:hypothetical protein
MEAGQMHQGTMIEELMAAVERAEQMFGTRERDVMELERWFASTERRAGQTDSTLAGVA